MDKLIERLRGKAMREPDDVACLLTEAADALESGSCAEAIEWAVEECAKVLDKKANDPTWTNAVRMDCGFSATELRSLSASLIERWEKNIAEWEGK